jgi:hypothetical protein
LFTCVRRERSPHTMFARRAVEDGWENKPSSIRSLLVEAQWKAISRELQSSSRVSGPWKTISSQSSPR